MLVERVVEAGAAANKIVAAVGLEQTVEEAAVPGVEAGEGGNLGGECVVGLEAARERVVGAVGRRGADVLRERTGETELLGIQVNSVDDAQEPYDWPSSWRCW